MRRLLWLVPLLFAGCFLVNSNEVKITYDVMPPQEFAQDFGNTGGNVPTVPCNGNAALCAAVPAPAGTMAECDATSRDCALSADLTPYQTVNLSQQSSFPSQVANSSVISDVTINNVFYWTQSNTLSFATPPIDIYVAPSSVTSTSDPSATLLGTMPSMPAGQLTAKTTLPLTDAGKSALGTLAKNYKTPFNVLAHIHVTVTAGQPVPSGKIDMFLEPEIAFGIPL